MYNNIIADEMFDTYPQQKELGKLLRDSREASKLDIYEMSEILKVSPSRLKQIENGDFSIMHEIYTKSLVARYAKHTGINIQKLFKQIWNDEEIEGKSSLSSSDNIKSAYLNVASLFSKDSAEIDKSGNHAYMLISGICAVAFGIFFLKSYTGETFFSKNQTSIASSSINNKDISVLTLDKELRSYKTISTTNASNNVNSKDNKLSKPLLASNRIGEDVKMASDGIIDASFTLDPIVIPASYIVKSDN